MTIGHIRRGKTKEGMEHRVRAMHYWKVKGIKSLTQEISCPAAVAVYPSTPQLYRY